MSLSNTYPDKTSYTYANPPLAFIDNLLPNPSRPFNSGLKVNTLVFAGDSGYEQRRLKGSPRHIFELAYVFLTLKEYQLLRQFFMEKLNIQAFSFTDPIEKQTYLVRFDQDTFIGNNKYHNIKGPGYEVSVKLLEVAA